MSHVWDYDVVASPKYSKETKDVDFDDYWVIKKWSDYGMPAGDQKKSKSHCCATEKPMTRLLLQRIWTGDTAGKTCVQTVNGLLW